jgi:hypothetical protein
MLRFADSPMRDLGCSDRLCEDSGKSLARKRFDSLPYSASADGRQCQLSAMNRHQQPTALQFSETEIASSEYRASIEKMTSGRAQRLGAGVG